MLMIIFFPVKVYVKLNHSSPRILCLTNRLRNLELIDPIVQWNGPSGSLSSGKELFSYMSLRTLSPSPHSPLQSNMTVTKVGM